MPLLVPMTRGTCSKLDVKRALYTVPYMVTFQLKKSVYLGEKCKLFSFLRLLFKCNTFLYK